jgi:hypothetical protein
LLKQIAPEQYPTVEWTKELFDSWVVQFAAPKQKRLRRALDRIPQFTQVEFAAKDIFEKVELLMKRHDNAWAGRIVNASTDLHNALSGPIISACLKRFVKAAADNALTQPKVSIQVAYGGSPQEFVSNMDGPGPFIEADFSSNDKMQVQDVGQLEFKWAIRFGMPEWLAKVILLANTYTARSRRFNLQAKLFYQLPSGSTSTTWRNSLWNATIFYSWARRYGVHATANILGDDMIARITNGIIPRRARRDYEHFANLARMKAKVKVNTGLVDCEFLSRRYVPTAHGYFVIPKLGKAFGRFNARGNPGDISDNQYVAGKSLSYAYEFRFYKPIMTLFLERFQACEVDFFKLDDRLLSYSVREAIHRTGSRRGVLDLLRAQPSISDDEFSQYTHYIYGKFRVEVVRDIEHLLFGDTDLSLPRSAPYLDADVW